jgi:hypothetical protein
MATLNGGVTAAASPSILEAEAEINISMKKTAFVAYIRMAMPRNAEKEGAPPFKTGAATNSGLPGGDAPPRKKTYPVQQPPEPRKPWNKRTTLQRLL